MKMIYACLLLLPLASFANGGIEISTGMAYNDDGKLAYKEAHKTVFSKNGLPESITTTYFSPDDKRIGKIESIFTQNLYLPEYSFNDYRFMRRAGTKWQSNSLLAYGKDDKDSPTKEMLITNPPKTMVTGQGLHAFVIKHMDKLIASDETKKINFLIPLNQDEYNFRIRKKSYNKDTGVIQLVVEIDNWFLRLIAPNINLKYDTNKKRLLEYYGASNLLDNNKKTQVVRIKYSYDEKIASIGEK